MGTSHVETCGATYGGECDRCPTDKGSDLVDAKALSEGCVEAHKGRSSMGEKIEP
jgi:hypothetical protein